jgi:D-alanyl-D-alanine carboxypeptidase/D-alanyl-D-alanine-endopeptidase (penicillin-binding protein 4)
VYRPPQATALLALVTLLGAEAPAAAGPSGDRPRLTVDPTEPAPSAVVVIPAAEPPGSWPERIDSRLRALAAEVTPAQPGPSAGSDVLHERLDALLHDAPNVSVGVAVRDLTSGAPLFFHDADRTLNPASNNKLLTAIAAVELLGGDYRFETRVLREGDTLYVVGEGDPSLQLEDLAGLVARAAADDDAGSVRHIVVDDSFFTARRFGPGYDTDGPGFSYEAPSGALSLQFNTVEIQVGPDAPDQPANVSVTPTCGHLRVVNEATTGRGDDLDIETHAEDGMTVVHVRGRIRSHARPVRIRRRITDPGLFFASTFADRYAAMTHAEPLDVARGVAPSDARVVARHDSAPLTEVLQSALLYSNNFTTEQVLRTLGARHGATAGDWANGRATLLAFWRAVGLPADTLTFENGSGYSRRGRVSADALVRLLALTARPGSDAAALVEVLPAPGEHGTLRRRLGRARGRVRAKTGTLRGASALSGIVQGDDGHPYGFSILVNGPISGDRSRRLQDRLVLALVDHLPR